MNALLTRATALALANSPSARTIAVDFDGVIHSDRAGWNGGRVSGKPLPGAIEKLRALLDGGWCIVICTARHSDFHEDVATWLGQHLQRKVIVLPGAETAYWTEPGLVLVTNIKPGALVYLDDKAQTFTGWDNALAGLPNSPDDIPLRPGSPLRRWAQRWQRMGRALASRIQRKP